MLEAPRFLIVEKDPKQVEIYSGFIREIHGTGHAQIDVALTIEDALQKLAGATYQVVVLEATAARGPAAIERLKGMNPNTGLILVALDATIEEAVKMVRLGAEDYFPKPVNPDSFKLAVKRSLDRRDLYSSDAQLSSFMNLINASQLVSASLDEQRVFETIMGYLKRETGCRGQALYRYNDGKFDRMATASDSDVDVIDVACEWANALPKTMQEKAECKLFPKSVVAPEILVFHFKWVGDRDCFAVCASPSAKSSVDDIFSRFRMLQVQVQLTAKNIGNFLSVREMLYRDDATSLHNARFLNLSLDKAFAAHQKSQSKFAVLFVDLDHFKKINDGHGHLIGTKLLNEVGEVLKGEVRAGDVICRYGGDEFVVILNNADLETAKNTAERIRKNIETRTFLETEGHIIKLTVSIGVAVCPDHARTKNDIVAAADNAMYVAKRSTRNMVYVFDNNSAMPAAAGRKAAA
jgi:diguanylate cyclase (GGDEF)-like protein